ncbi:response regulator [Thioalkalivibrio paradoxus]|uniref:LuxR family transcriptional regulator n=1 Tax=Thioalkalivibrio paradoxus ARh 1 TaxID=713585 RepID=W0DR80_9GAMM|nr:response regulator transcription factor [Thioalkalivibrio paradoxus]AHE99742.1 LuxR family transcriptional regulator [Thioalkalivibrio paradoxus ARh 1]
MTSVCPIRVLLVDDHRLVRAGVRGLLLDAGDFAVVGEAASCEEACRVAGGLEPDVIVLDISLPGVSGIEGIARLRRIVPGAAILMLSMHESDPLLKLALGQGASGYLSKRSAPQELATAVRAVAAGGTYLEGAMAHAIATHAEDDTAPGIASLGPREFEVFVMLARGHSVKEIGLALHLSPKTIHTHRARVLEKLGVHCAAELVQLAVEAGVVEP